MRRCAAWMMLSQVLLCAAGGCGGGYLMTAGDQLAPAGGQAATVVRLRQAELPMVTPPARDVAVRFFVGDCPQRSARTDAKGYASAAVPVPAAAGTYDMTLAVQDIRGDEADWTVRTFVWDPSRPSVAIELEAVPKDGEALVTARVALTALAARANIVYLTHKSVEDHERCRCYVESRGLPDGPVLSWRAVRWPGKGVISPLADLRGQFPQLNLGVGRSDLARSVFDQAGMRTIQVDNRTGAGWAELPDAGL